MNCGVSDKGPIAAVAMVARPRELLRELREGADTVKALKAIKNQVIGSKTKKAAFISEGAVEQVLNVLKKTSSKGSDDQTDLVQQQAAIVIGSLTYGTETGLRELIAHQGLPHLVDMLHSCDGAVVEAGLRAIKMVMQQSSSLPSYLVSQSAGHDATAGDVTVVQPAAAGSAALCLEAAAVAAVVRCLGNEAAAAVPDSGSASSSAVAVPAAGSGPANRSNSVAALAAAVVACCCRREEERQLAIASGAPAGLLGLLLGSERPDTQIAALEGLSLMLPQHPPACALALARPGVYGRLLALLREPSPSVRLLAAGCIATLSRTPGCEQSEAMQRAALPVLLRLLAQPATRPHVPAVLARLIEGSEPLQKAAADADTVRLLAGLLAAEAAALAPPAAPAAAEAASAASVAAASTSPRSSASALREGCLRALGSLCLNRDDSRKQLLEAKVLRHIVKSLEDPCDGVRAAAALCVRALSRCVRSLRGGLLDGGGELAPVLVGLLGDDNVDVQASAAAAVCNLVLDFSAAKSAVLAAGGLSRLVALTASSQPPLRHHAAWALGNLLYRSDNSVRSQLMQALPWPRLRELLSDPDPGVVEQALVILRNLCMGDHQHIAAAIEWAGAGCQQDGSHHYQAVQQQQQQQQQEGKGLLAVLQERIEAAAGRQSPGASHDDASSRASTPAAAPAQHTLTHATHALYAVANLLTGGPAVKDAVVARRPLLAAVAAHLLPTAGELALPAVWCVINLTWPAAGGGGGGGEQQQLLQQQRWTSNREIRMDYEAVGVRCRALMAVGGAERLEELQQRHHSRDVQERARTALEQLRRGASSADAAAVGLL